MKKYLLFMLLLAAAVSHAAENPAYNANSMVGTNFIFSVPAPELNSQNNDKSENNIILTLLAHTDAEVKVTAKHGFIHTHTLKAYERAIVLIPAVSAFTQQKSSSQQALPHEVYKSAAIQIEADNPISAFAMVKNGSISTESFAVLPVEALGKKYTVASYNEDHLFPKSSRPSMTTVTAAYDGTEVQFILGGNPDTELAYGTFAGDTVVAILNRGDVWALSSTGLGADLSGSIVMASRPVAVVSGNQNADIPQRNLFPNYIVEMDLAHGLYGKKYYVPCYPDRRHSPVLRIFAKEDSTKVYLNNNEFLFINKAGGTIHTGYAEARINQNNSPMPAVLTADKPVSVVLYNAGVEEEGVNATIDYMPFQMQLVPHEQELKDYIISPPTYRYANQEIFAHNMLWLVVELENNQLPASLKFGEYDGSVWHWESNNIIQTGEPVLFAYDAESNTQSALYCYKIKNHNTYHITCDNKFALYSVGQPMTASQTGSIAGSYGLVAGMGTLELFGSDTAKPVPVWQQACNGDVTGTVQDYPIEAENRSNLALPIFYAQESYNYDKEFDKVTPGETSSISWRLFVRDKSRSAKAVIKFSDRAGNDTAITVEYFAPDISALPSTCNFGILKENEKHEMGVKIKNNSLLPFNIVKATFKRYPECFTFLNSPTGIIQPNQEKELLVQFQPNRSGIFRDTIVLNDNCSNYAVAVVEGAVGYSEIVAADVNFNECLVNTEYVQDCKVENFGDCDLVISGCIPPKNAVFGVNFPIEFSEDKPLILKKGERFDFKISFKSSYEQEYTDSLVFISDAFISDSITHITAKSVNPGLIAESYNWGDVRIYRNEFPTNPKGAGNGSKGITVENKSGYDITIDSVLIKDIDGNSASGFIFDDLIMDALVNRTMRPNEKYIIPIDFFPFQLKEYFVDIHIVSKTGKHSVSNLRGKGTVPKIRSAYGEFDTLLVNNFDCPQTQTIVINNLRGGEWEYADSLTVLNISSPDNSVINKAYSNSGFMMDIDENAFPIKIPAGESYAFNCQFVPKLVGENLGKLVVISDAMANDTIHLKGYGTSKNILFQNTNLKLCQGEQGIISCIIKNNGNLRIKLNNFYFSPPSEVFEIHEDMNEEIELAPNETKVVNIEFNPKSIGVYSSFLRFNVTTDSYQSVDSVEISAISELTREFIDMDLSSDSIKIGTPLIAKINLQPDSPHDIDAEKIDITIKYDADILYPNLSDIRLGKLLSGKFVIDEIKFNNHAKEIRIVVKTINKYSFANSGEMIILPFDTYFPIKDGKYVNISAEISTDNNCVAFVPASVLAELTGICAFELRYINLSGTEYFISEATPNPANSNVNIDFAVGLDCSALTNIKIFSSNGSLIYEPVNTHLSVGRYNLQINTKNLPSGVYYYSINSAHFSATKKFIIAK